LREVVLSRRRVSVLLALVVAALGIGLWGAVGFASPKAAAAHHNNDKGRTLTILSKNTEARVVDLGPQGPTHGDIRAVNAPLYNATGKEKVGRLDLFCVTTDPADEPNEKADMAECTATYTLPGGEIVLQGVQAYPKFSEVPPEGVNAITGGTGKYAGVGGEGRFETRGNNVIRTLHFVG
jgi:hypothetical protein